MLRILVESSKELLISLKKKAPKIVYEFQDKLHVWIRSQMCKNPTLCIGREAGKQEAERGVGSINRFQWKGVLPSMSKSIHMVCYLHSCSWSSLSFACSPLAAEAVKFRWGHRSQIIYCFNHPDKILWFDMIKTRYDFASVFPSELNVLSHMGDCKQ